LDWSALALVVAESAGLKSSAGGMRSDAAD
jgi:hypothetical protein